jgi:hypothetical protein
MGPGVSSGRPCAGARIDANVRDESADGKAYYTQRCEGAARENLGESAGDHRDRAATLVLRCEQARRLFTMRAGKEERTMTARRTTQAPMFCVALILGWVVACTVLTAQGMGEEPTATRASSLVGTWRVIVNRGTTGEFHALMMFHPDGTLATTNSDATVGPGMGVWRSLPGVGNREATFEFFWDSNGDGVFDRRLRVYLPIQLLDHTVWVADAVTDVLSLDGNFIFRIPIVFPNEATRFVP